MTIRDKNGKELSPCIISKARFALGLKSSYRSNKDKPCSQAYWHKTIDVVAKFYGVNDEGKIKKAKNRTDLFKNKEKKLKVF